MVNLPILETRWPLYAVVWNCDGIIAVGGGDCLVRRVKSEINQNFNLFKNQNLIFKVICF